jgi:hypothetical protein
MKSLFEKKYDRVVIRAYASMKRAKFSALLGAVRAMGADYLVIADNDHAPCVTFKKDLVCRGISGLQPQRIRVVVEEIESWYAAGLDREDIEKLETAFPANTDGLTKEEFNELVPERFDSRIDFMMEILKVFSLDSARIRNASLDYFLHKEGLVQSPAKAAGERVS